MGEMADPMLFQAQESLLDSSDSIQAYKWYQKAAAQGDETLETALLCRMK